MPIPSGHYPLETGARHRIAIGVEYDGSQLHGWQRQSKPAVATVQGHLEEALASVANQSVKLYCAGRTDAGVHATAQVAHFDVTVDRGEKAWVMGVNSQLPRSVRVRWARPVADNFHARYAAEYRRYQYWIDNTPVASALHAGRITWHRLPLDAERMHEAAQALLGENDFSSFQAAACQSPTPMRNMQRITVARREQRLCIDVQANAFLLHMVRNIVGALLEVGSGRESVELLARLLAAKDRNLAPATAKPDGLYLVEVAYGDCLGAQPASVALF